MRNLFLALLLANIGFAAWHFWLAEPPPSGRGTVGDLPGITLVSEADPALLRAQAALAQSAAASADRAAQPPRLGEPIPELSPAAEGVAAVFTAQRCISVGPYRELAQAAAAASGLRAAGHATSQRVAEGEVWVGYWVYLDGIATLTEANELLERVRAGGVTDSYVISGAEAGHLVSLGVFSESARAALRREQIQSLGLEPVIADRTQHATVYWVDVNVASDEALDFDTLQAPGRIMRLEQRPCPAD